MVKHEIMVVGIGNAYRNDDGIGCFVAQLIQRRNIPGVCVIEERGEGTDLLEVLRSSEKVILVDAVVSGAEPGTIFRFDAEHREIPSELFRYSTHAFGVAGVIELARVYKQLPMELTVFGIEANNFESGTELSAEVKKAGAQVAERIFSECESWRLSKTSKTADSKDPPVESLHTVEE